MSNIFKKKGNSLKRDRSELLSVWNKLSDDLKLDLARRWLSSDKKMLERLDYLLDDFAERLRSSLETINAHSSASSPLSPQEQRELEAAIRDFHSLVRASRINPAWFSQLSDDMRIILRDFDKFIRIADRRRALKGIAAGLVIASASPKIAFASSGKARHARFEPGVITAVGSTAIIPVSKRDVGLIYIYYRSGRESHEIVLSGDDIDLLKTNHLVIDGFAISVHVWLKGDLQPSFVKGKHFPFLLRASDSSISVGLPFVVGEQYSIPVSILPRKYSRAVSSGFLSGFRGWAAGMVKTRKDSLTDDDFIPISLLGDLIVKIPQSSPNVFKGFLISQEGGKTLKKISLVEGIKSDDIAVRYIGSPEEIPGILKLRNRFRIAAKEIFRVEKAVGEDLADYLTIIDSTAENASVHERSVSVLLPLFLSTSDDEFALTVRHETLHLADLKFKTYAHLQFWHRKFLFEAAEGRSLGISSSQPNIFSFIKESAFFGIFPEAGHPMSSPFEFATSFLHTLLFPDLLKKRLSELDSGVRSAITWQYLLLLYSLASRFKSGKNSESLYRLLSGVIPVADAKPAIIVLNATQESFENAVNGLREMQDLVSILKHANRNGFPVFIVETEGGGSTAESIMAMKTSSWAMLKKNGSSAFEKTGLKSMLSKRGVRSVLVAGSDQGRDVFYTCRDAITNGFMAVTSFSLIQGKKSGSPKLVTDMREISMYLYRVGISSRNPVVVGTTEYFRKAGRVFKITDVSSFPDGITSLKELVLAYRKMGVWLFPDASYLYFVYKV